MRVQGADESEAVRKEKLAVMTPQRLKGEAGSAGKHDKAAS